LLNTRPAESGFGSVRRGPLRWPATERHPEIRVRCADPPRSRRASVGPSTFGSPGGSGLRTEPDRSWMETMSVWPEAGALHLLEMRRSHEVRTFGCGFACTRSLLREGTRAGSTRCPSGRRGRVAHRRPTLPLRWSRAGSRCRVSRFRSRCLRVSPAGRGGSDHRCLSAGLLAGRCAGPRCALRSVTR